MASEQFTDPIGVEELIKECVTQSLNVSCLFRLMIWNEKLLLSDNLMIEKIHFSLSSHKYSFDSENLSYLPEAVLY